MLQELAGSATVSLWRRVRTRMLRRTTSRAAGGWMSVWTTERPSASSNEAKLRKSQRELILELLRCQSKKGDFLTKLLFRRGCLRRDREDSSRFVSSQLVQRHHHCVRRARAKQGARVDARQQRSLPTRKHGQVWGEFPSILVLFRSVNVT